MDNLPRQIAAEVENVEAALRNLEEAPLESLTHNIPRVWSEFISEVAQQNGANTA